MNFSGLLAVVDLGPVVLALTAVAALVIVPAVVRWGFDQVVGWFDSDHEHGMRRPEAGDLDDPEADESEDEGWRL